MMMDRDPRELPDSGNRLSVLRESIMQLLTLEKELNAFLEQNGFHDLDGIRQKLNDTVPAEEAARLREEICTLQASGLVAQAFRDGKLTEAERAWADRFARTEPQAFRDWCLTAPRRIPDNAGIEQRTLRNSSGARTDEEVRIFRMLGLEPAKAE